MATKVHKIVGQAKWAKVFEQNRDMEGFEGAAKAYDGQYSINVVLAPAKLKEFKATGSAAQPKINADTGEVFVTLKRKHKDRFDWAGGAPKVFKADGTPWSLDDDGLIGNGSEVEVEFEVYTTKMSPGTRLKSVKVLEHVAYESAAKTEEVKSDMDDEVPF